MGADLWSPIATSCNPTPGIGRNFPHLVMQAWEKYSIQHVSKAGSGPDWSDYTQMAWLPSEAGSWAPLLHDCVLFGQEHGNFSIQTTASIHASASSPPKPANALGGVFHL